MRKLSMILALSMVASVSNACVASRKFVRNEDKKTADTVSSTLNARVDKTDGEVSEVRDGVARVDGKVNTVDGRVSSLDAKTSARFDTVNGDVKAVDQKAGNAQSSADKASTAVMTLDDKFQNRNQFSVAGEKSILFKFDSAKLDSKYMADLEEVASMVTKNPDALLVLEGRTDAKGDQDYNVKLGERRVDSVKRYLAVEKGVPIYRIHEISFGAAKPVAENKTREGREQNRAVVVTILVPKATMSTSASMKTNP